MCAWQSRIAMAMCCNVSVCVKLRDGEIEKKNYIRICARVEKGRNLKPEPWLYD